MRNPDSSILILVMLCLGNSAFAFQDRSTQEDDASRRSSLGANDRQIDSGDLKVLGDKNIPPTAAGITKYFGSLKPDQSEIETAQALIRLLGDPKYSVRESASQEIIALPKIPVELLKKELNSPNVEIAHRVKKILEDANTKRKLIDQANNSTIIEACLRVIRDQPIPGLAESIISSLDEFDQVSLELIADALIATALDSNLEALKNLIASPNVDHKLVSIRAWSAVAGDDSTARLKELSQNSDQNIALVAAHALAEKGDRSCLDVLADFQSSKDVSIRKTSIQILRSLTGQNFGLNPYVVWREQDSATQKWRDWIKSSGQTAKLNLPLKLAPLPEEVKFGLAIYYSFDKSGRGKILDQSGNNRHGSTQNRTRYVKHGNGRALRIVGTGKHGTTGGHALIPHIDIEKMSEFSIAIWVYETGMSHEEGEAYITFGADRGATIDGAAGIAHFNDKIHYRVGRGSISVPFDPAKQRDQWVHYALTYKSGFVRAYENGILVGEKPATVSAAIKVAALGRHWWNDGGGTSTRFQGMLDEVRVYERALSQEQIKLLLSVD